MGTNKRYPEIGAKRAAERTVEAVMTGTAPHSLTDDELELSRQPLTKTPRPHVVTAWVRYGDTPLRVSAKVVAWTPRAIAITWETPSGAEHRAWVWASAVERPAL